MCMESVKHRKRVNWNTQGRSSSSPTDELVSTAVMQLPARADVDTSPQGPVILSETPYEDLTAGPPADITHHRSQSQELTGGFFLLQRGQTR